MRLCRRALGLVFVIGAGTACSEDAPDPSATPGGGGANANGGGVTVAGTPNAASGSAAGGAGSGGTNQVVGGASGIAGGAAGGGASNGGEAGAPLGGSAGQASGGSAGQASGGAGQAGSGGSPAGTPNGVTVTTHDLGVPSGVVFNVADDYFNDGFVPATPVANFGLHSQITTLVNADGSLDVAWLDYTSGKGKPWAVTSPGTIYLSHVAADLGSATTQASGISSYKLLGFTKDAAGAFYLAYNKDHPFKSTTAGNQNNLNGNELHVTKLSGGSPVWDKLIFGDQDNSLEGTLGDPAGASSSVLGYDATNQRVVLYCGHSMMWTPTRHQAGFIRLIDPSNGNVTPPAGQDITHLGAGWWYSHNFNQRLYVEAGKYYMLAHGDAYARQLGFARWSYSGYVNDNESDFDQSYWDIAGSQGDNKTDTQTGQFVKLADGRFAIVHTSSQTRSARDVRVILASGTDGTADTAHAIWLTSNQGTTQATMPKVELLGDYVLITYALWDSGKGHALTWYAALLDDALATVVAPQAISGVEFVDSAPLFRFPAGPNAGAVGWVSGNASHTLSVRVASASYP